MLADLSPLIAATSQWLLRAYPPCGGPMAAALCEAQARLAVGAAAWLRYPTPMDAALVGMAGPGGPDRLTGAAGNDIGDDATNDTRGDPGNHSGRGLDDAPAWHTWVDEVVASWAACLLGDTELADRAVDAVAADGRAAGLAAEFRRLAQPTERDRQAAALLRHPDLLAPVAALHRAQLMARLSSGQALVP
ncbi:hypothetical protein [Streptomyces mangrovisoli]|uniref:Uncharacterized protein n=1 Tax=Streptomyces mangrovisoli TaxID=1428628 RepID=A0A1J4NZ10_9ACTN|nr:hypothetical protein [Streptomyces mangrovisoli]OIJ66414.1 hypothetical protein WN71_018655 [Streptomyces mangrovisoli]